MIQPRGRTGLGAPAPLTIKEIVDLFGAREFDADVTLGRSVEAGLSDADAMEVLEATGLVVGD